MKSHLTLPHDHGGNTAEILKDQPADKTFADVSAVFALISDSTRLKILWLLCHGEECVINIAAVIKMSSPAVSHHLRILKQAGLITSRKDGKEVYYTLSKERNAAFVHSIIDNVIEELRCQDGSKNKRTQKC